MTKVSKLSKVSQADPALALRGTRPSAPREQRTASAYIFGAICQARGEGAGLVLPRCTTEGMSVICRRSLRRSRPTHTPSASLTRPAGTGRRARGPAQHHADAAPGQVPELNLGEKV